MHIRHRWQCVLACSANIQWLRIDSSPEASSTTALNSHIQWLGLSSSRSRLHFCQAFAWLHQNHASLTTTSYLEVHYSGMATEQRTCRKDSSLVSARASAMMIASWLYCWLAVLKYDVTIFTLVNSTVIVLYHCTHLQQSFFFIIIFSTPLHGKPGKLKL